jgi:hypothetical protein
METWRFSADTSMNKYEKMMRTHIDRGTHIEREEDKELMIKTMLEIEFVFF